MHLLSWFANRHKTLEEEEEEEEDPRGEVHSYSVEL